MELPLVAARGLSMEKVYRMLAMCEGEDDSVVPVEDAGRLCSMQDIEKWAMAIIDGGNAPYIEIYQADQLVRTLYPKLFL